MSQGKEKSIIEEITGLLTACLGIIFLVAPLLFLKVTPGATVNSGVVCNPNGTCLTAGDLAWFGLALVIVGALYLFKSGGAFRRGIAPIPFLGYGKNRRGTIKAGLGGLQLSGIVVFILAFVVLILRPIPDKVSETCFWIFCENSGDPLIFGLDPDLFLALMFAILGTILLIFGTKNAGGASGANLTIKR